jgi:hypothetical protein
MKIENKIILVKCICTKKYIMAVVKEGIQKKELIQLYPIVPVDESIKNLKKIEVNNQTKFFRNGKPIVWYCKHNNNKLVFYNSFGFDPETGKPLKPITNYMIKKYYKIV